MSRIFVALLAGALALAALAAPEALSAPVQPPADAAPPPRDAGADAWRLDQTPPDPKPLVTKERWLFDLRYRAGEPRLVAVTRVDLPKPEPTARVFGRFAIELFEGNVLVERVRFDFPMLAEPADKKAIDLEKKLSTRIGVYFPRTPRGTRLELWDRATDRRWSLPWPPEAGPQPAK